MPPSTPSQDILSDCRFCSQVSQANGEDPIGSADPFDYFLVMEVKQPWPVKLFQESPMLQPLMSLVKNLILDHGVRLKPIAIAPDPDYSQPGHTRILKFSRPSGAFAQFDRQEFLVPDAEATALATALLQQLMKESVDLTRFHPYQQSTTPIRDLLICTHAQVDAACGKFGIPLYRTLRQEYASLKDHPLRVWQATHFGGHQFAPTLVDLPQGRFWGHLEPDILDVLIRREGPVSKLSPFYRGWSGLSKFEQIAEREVWMQEGWEWLTYPVKGQILTQDTGGFRTHLYNLLRLVPSKLIQFLLKQRSASAATWAKVRLEFMAPDQEQIQAYEARVEISGAVMSASKSGNDMEIKPVRQYRVSQLAKVQS
jgi:hypothetical protein